MVILNYAGKFDASLSADGSGSHSGEHFHIDSIPHHGLADAVVIPNAHLLFSGDYQKSGVDLIVSDRDHRVVVHDYFRGEKRPALVSSEGAPLDPKVIEALTGHLEYAQAAGGPSAAKLIGHVVKMTGSASVVRNGVTVTVNIGDNVYQNDVVQTGSGSSLGLVLNDGTTFNMSASARLMLNDLVYDANSTTNTSLFTLVEGAASFVAGQIAKTGDMKVATPVATLGIRGTAVILDISSTDGTVSVSVVDQHDGTVHALEVKDNNGNVIGTVTSNGTGLTLTPTATFAVIAQESNKTPAQVAQEFNAFQSLLQTYEAAKLIYPDLPQHTENNANPNQTKYASLGSTPNVPPDTPTTTLFPAGHDTGLNTNPSPGVTAPFQPTDVPPFIVNLTGSPQLIIPPTQQVSIPPTQQVSVPQISLPFVVAPPPIKQVSSGSGNHFNPVMSADGRFVTYDPDGAIFLYDRQSNTTSTIASASNGFTFTVPTISSDGHYVVYQGSNGTQSFVFLYDNNPSDANYQQTTQLASGGSPAIDGNGGIIAVENGGSAIGVYNQQGNLIATITPAAVGSSGTVWKPAISADGHVLAFWSSDSATTGGAGHLFTYNLATGAIAEIASTTSGVGKTAASISADGHYLVYQSDVGLPTQEIFLYDLAAGKVIFSTAGVAGASYNPVISPDGHFIIFASNANLTPDDTNSVADTYVVDVTDPSHPVYKLVSVLADGTQGDAASDLGGTISAGGLFVAFGSSASNFSTGNTSSASQIFVVDPTSGRSAVIDETASSPSVLTASGVIQLTGANGAFSITVSDPTGTLSASELADKFNAVTVVDPNDPTNPKINWTFTELKTDFNSLPYGQSSTENFIITLTSAAGSTTIPVKVGVFDAQQPAIVPPTVTITTAAETSNVATQTISGTVSAGEAAAGGTVTLFDTVNGVTTQLGTASVVNGSWTTHVTLSGDGAHSIVAEDTDAAGNTGTSAPVLLTLDTVPPTVTITTAAETSNVATQAISGTVSAGEAAAGGTVTLFDTVNGVTTQLGTASVVNGTWTTHVTLSGDGAHSIVAEDTDAAGNTGTSAPVLLTLDTVPPTVTITSVSGATTVATHMITGTADPADAGTTITIFDSVTAAGAGSVTPVAAALLTAGHDLTNGLGGSAGFGNQALAIGDDNSSPAINITSIFGAAGVDFFGHNYTSLYINNNGNITFASPNGAYTPSAINGGANNPIIAPFWADVDTRGGPGSATPGGNSTGANEVFYNLNSVNGVMTITWDDVGYYYAATNKLDAFQLQLINVGGGNFDIVYRYENINWTTGDASGGTNGLGGTPARAGYSAGDGTHYFELPQSGNQASLLSLPATIGNTGIQGVDVFQVFNGQVSPPTVSVVGTAIVQADGTWTANVTLANGTNSIVAKDTDAAGNTGTSAPVLLTLDTVAPTVTITTAAETSNVATQTISGTVSAGEAAAGGTVTLFDTVNGVTTQLGTASVVNGTWTTHVTLPGDGAHSIVAEDTDAAGNTGTSAPVLLTLDTVPPTVTITTAAETSNVATQTISGTVSAGEAAAGGTVTLFDTVNGVTTQLGTASVVNGSWTTHVTLSGDGAHSIVAEDTDAAGNTGTSAPVLLTLDTVPPTVTITTAAETSNVATQTISGTVSAGEAAAGGTVTLFDTVNGVTTQLGTASVVNGTWTTHVTLSGDGAHSIVAEDTDAAGNTGTSAPVLLTLDTLATILSATTAAEGNQITVLGVTEGGNAVTTGLTYSWQVSNDGVNNWTPVAATNYYAPIETDEGKSLRLVTTHTDPVSGNTEQTINSLGTVADITPTITAPYTFAVDEFKVVKGDAVFDDTFGQAPPAGGNFGSTPVSFTTLGSTWSDVGSKAIMSSTGSVVFADGGASVVARLRTDTQDQSQSSAGLKENSTFSVSGTFDLVTPTYSGDQYGINLNDSTGTHANDEMVEIFVTRSGSGGAIVDLVQANYSTATFQVIASQALSADQLSGNNQIRLNLIHGAANTSAITGSFDLLNNGNQTSTETFAPTGHVFDNVTYTRAEIFAFGPELVAITGTAKEGQTLTANVSTNDSDATIHYQWQYSSDGINWSNVGTDSSQYVLTEADEGLRIHVVATTANTDNSSTASVTSAATAVVQENPAENATIALAGLTAGNAVEGQQITATVNEPDAPSGSAGFTYTWTVGGQTVGGTGNTYTPTQADEGKVINVAVSFTDTHGFAETGTASAGTVARDVPTIDQGPQTASVADGGTWYATGHLTASDPVSGEPLTWHIVGGNGYTSENYQYAIDEFAVTKVINGTSTPVFDDTFTGTVPPAGPNLLVGSMPSGSSYYDFGSGTYVSGNGVALINGSNAGYVGTSLGVASYGDPVFGQFTTLLTGTSYNAVPGDGLRSGQSFSVNGLFDLTIPPDGNTRYGIRLSDRVSLSAANDQLGTEVVDLGIVRNGNGTASVLLSELNYETGVSTTLQVAAINIPNGDNEILLSLSNDAANNGQVQASYTLEKSVNGVEVADGSPITLAAVGHIFDNENWTRPQFYGLSTATTTSSSPQADSVLQGTYGQLDLAQDGTWHYFLNPGLPSVKALPAGQTAQDNFQVAVTNAAGGQSTQTISVTVTGDQRCAGGDGAGALRRGRAYRPEPAGQRPFGQRRRRRQ